VAAVAVEGEVVEALEAGMMEIDLETIHSIRRETLGLEDMSLMMEDLVAEDHAVDLEIIAEAAVVLMIVEAAVVLMIVEVAVVLVVVAEIAVVLEIAEVLEIVVVLVIAEVVVVAIITGINGSRKKNMIKTGRRTMLRRIGLWVQMDCLPGLL